jgi:mRNA-degrading endonuclease toxin of MazEF toxin-antitoxin module
LDKWDKWDRWDVILACRKPRVANASTIMSYERRRIVSRAGRVTSDALAKIDRARAVHLGLADP